MIYLHDYITISVKKSCRSLTQFASPPYYKSSAAYALRTKVPTGFEIQQPKNGGDYVLAALTRR